MIFLFLFFSIHAQAATPTFFNDLENFKNKNLTLQSEKSNLQASDDLLNSKRLFWTPKLSVSAVATESKINSEPHTEGNYLQGQLSWNVFRGGADWNSFRGAKAQYKAQVLQVQNEIARVEVKASDLIFKSLFFSEIQKIQEQILKLKEESYKIVSNRYHQGQIPLQELTKSDVDLTQQKSRMRQAKLDLVENKSQMASLFVADIRTSSWPFSENTKTLLNNDATAPLLEQKYWLSQSREEQWNAAKGLHWPTVDLQIQYQESPIKERSLQQLSGSIVMTLPLWSQLDTLAQVSVAYAQYMTTLNEFKDSEIGLKQKQLFLNEKIESSRLNLIDAKKNLEISRKLYQDIIKSFRIGRLSTNDLFLEQNRLLESENALATSQLAFHQSLIETCALAGVTAAICLHE